MKKIFSDQLIGDEIKHSIFLVGPTPRNSETKSWRPKAISILESLNYKGTIFIPEYSNWKQKVDYNNQVNWEWEALHKSNLIVAWVDRSMPDMPAFTTNVEFGFWIRDIKFFYGRPNTAVKCDYLDWMYRKIKNKDPHNDLQLLLEEALESKL